MPFVLTITGVPQQIKSLWGSTGNTAKNTHQSLLVFIWDFHHENGELVGKAAHP